MRQGWRTQYVTTHFVPGGQANDKFGKLTYLRNPNLDAGINGSEAKKRLTWKRKKTKQLRKAGIQRQMSIGRNFNGNLKVSISHKIQISPFSYSWYFVLDFGALQFPIIFSCHRE